MNAKLLSIAIASLISTSVFAGECPARAGVCQSYTQTISQPRDFQGAPVAQVNGRAAPEIARASSSKSTSTVVRYEHLYKFGRA